MPDCEEKLRKEVRRIVHQCTRAIFAPLQKDVGAMKHVVTDLKRESQKLSKMNARLAAALKSQGPH